ncbi:MAG: RluA family pseudouridine synthase [Clostridiales bacterium]|jgi:23S rRNA pseudouridine1911/1915/1917 synthase|nr:RluA family pseudouridine synthase [Clostridiales bacterium]
MPPRDADGGAAYRLVSAAGVRLDKFLSEEIPSLSRSHAQKLIADGCVLVDGATVKSNYVSRGDQTVEVTVPAPAALTVAAEDIPLDIVYEDDWLIVVNKQQGMVVHPAAGNYSGTLVNALLFHCGGSLSQINGVIRPGIVHRIDKDTSGLLLAAKNNAAHLSLSEQIKAHTVTRKYIALVHGGMREDCGTIDLPIGRHPTDRKKMCVTNKNARNAVTHYTVLERFGNYTFIECRLETGRTHQIRTHMAQMGHPILGDKVYGVKKEKFALTGQLLHAKVLGFTHPESGRYMEFDGGIPPRFEKILKIL